MTTLEKEAYDEGFRDAERKCADLTAEEAEERIERLSSLCGDGFAARYQAGYRAFLETKMEEPECDGNEEEALQEIEDYFGKPISIYTRKQAIAEGMLIDVSETAREAGFRIPVAITYSVYQEYVRWTEEDTQRQTYQDEPGRLWDVLFMAAHGCRSNKDSQQVSYDLMSVRRGGIARIPTKRTLKAVIGPGDTADPVVTIMLPEED